jgi:hypothetical protein
MPVRRRLLAVALGLGRTTSLAACAAEPQQAATSRVTTEPAPAPAAAAPARAAVSAACTAPPEVSARRVGDVIRVRWTARVPAACGQAYLFITGHSTSIEAPAMTTTEQDIDASAGSGEATIRLVVDHPPHVVRASLNMGKVVEVPVALARDLRRAIEAGGSWAAESMRCRPDGRCHGSFSLLHGRERVGMTYVVRTRRGTACRVVTSISVTKPIPAWENTAPPTAGNVGCGPR